MRMIHMAHAVRVIVQDEATGLYHAAVRFDDGYAVPISAECDVETLRVVGDTTPPDVSWKFIHDCLRPEPTLNTRGSKP